MSFYLDCVPLSPTDWEVMPPPHREEDSPPPTAVEEDLWHAKGYSLNPNHQIGRGMSGMVIRGVDRRTNSPVAAKVSWPKHSAYENIRRERELLMVLADAPHIARMRDSFAITLQRDERRRVMVSDLICSSNTLEEQPQNLQALLASRPLSWQQKITCLKQLLECLVTLKEKNIVHGDIKPLNIIFNPESNLLWLLDFGSARTPEHDRTQLSSTMAYCPPDDLLGHAGEIPGFDMWSLGVTFFQLTTGEFPFFNSHASTRLKILQCIFANLGKPTDAYLRGCPYHPLKTEKNWKHIIRQTAGIPTEQVVAFLEKIFRYENRLTPEEALLDPLLSEDLHVQLNCEMVPKPLRKTHFLSTQGLVIPLTASCIHLSATDDSSYQIKMIDIAGKCCHAFTITLKKGDELFVVKPNLLEKYRK